MNVLFSNLKVCIKKERSPKKVFNFYLYTKVMQFLNMEDISLQVRTFLGYSENYV